MRNSSSTNNGFAFVSFSFFSCVCIYVCMDGYLIARSSAIYICICLCSLKLLFDKHAHKAVAIVDSERVSCLVDEHSGRKVYRVKGQRSGETYTVLPEHFCSCHSHFYDIVTKSEGVYVRGGVFCFWM